MSTNSPTAPAISKLIEQLLFEYEKSPLRYLREIGHQTRLHSLLSQSFPERVRVRVVDGKNQAESAVTTTHTLSQVQLEAKIRPSSSGSVAQKDDQRYDIVVLRNDLDTRLTRYPNGALDIVAIVDATNVVAAIELKAACSADPEQRHRFRKDVVKLLRLNQTTGVAGHFVLIDKSLPFPGFDGSSKLPKTDWDVEAWDQASTWGKKAENDGWATLPRIDLLDPGCAAENGSAVHVWDLHHDDLLQAYTVRHRVARFA